MHSSPWPNSLDPLIFCSCKFDIFFKVEDTEMYKNFISKIKMPWCSNCTDIQIGKQQTAKDQDYFEILEYLGCITLAAGCPLKRQGDPLLWSIRWAQEWSNNKKRSCTWILFFSCLQENCTGMSVSRFFKVMEFRRWIPESCKL